MALVAIAIALTTLVVIFASLNPVVPSATNAVQAEADSPNVVETESHPDIQVGDTSPTPSDAVEIYSRPQGLFGLDLTELWSIYESNIESATSGDPASQFEVSRALFECQRLPTAEDLDGHLAAGRINGEMADAVRAKIGSCQLIVENVPNVTEQYEFWLDASARSGYPLALGRQVAFNPGKFSPSQARDIMLAVVREGGTESYSQVVSYITNYEEDNVIAHQAWMILACEANQYCDRDHFREQIRDEYSPNVQAQTDAMVSELRTAISERRWDDLNL